MSSVAAKNVDKTVVDMHNHAADQMNSHELDQLNNKKEYENADLKNNQKLAEGYEREAQSAYVKHLRNASENSNISGTKKYAIETTPDGNWDVSNADVEHDNSTYKVPVKRGPRGHILSLGTLNAAKQSTDLLNNFISHHGVLGMKWGHRKGSSSSSSPKAKVSEDYIKSEAHKQQVKEHGTQALSNKELQELVTRMNLEQQHRNLVNNNTKPSKFERGQKHINTVLSVGRTLNDINNLAKSPVGKAIKTGVKAGKAAKAAKQIAETAAE